MGFGRHRNEFSAYFRGSKLNIKTTTAMVENYKTFVRKKAHRANLLEHFSIIGSERVKVTQVLFYSIPATLCLAQLVKH